MERAGLLAEYQAGPGLVRSALAGLTPEQLRARPVPGRWSIRQVVLHLADAEILYADRMKRVITEHEPALSPPPRRNGPPGWPTTIGTWRRSWPGSS